MSVCPVCAPTLESLDLETSFSVCRNIYIKFIYQGHQVKVKVAGANTESMCPVWALTFECLDLKNSFLVHRYIIKTSKSRSCVKVMGQGHTSVTKYTHVVCPDLLL